MTELHEIVNLDAGWVLGTSNGYVYIIATKGQNRYPRGASRIVYIGKSGKRKERVLASLEELMHDLQSGDVTLDAKCDTLTVYAIPAAQGDDVGNMEAAFFRVFERTIGGRPKATGNTPGEYAPGTVMPDHDIEDILRQVG